MSKEAIRAAMPARLMPPDSRMIDVYVRRARMKLALAGSPESIATVWGRGYMAAVPQGGDDDPATPLVPRRCDAALVPA